MVEFLTAILVIAVVAICVQVSGKLQEPSQSQPQHSPSLLFSLQTEPDMTDSAIAVVGNSAVGKSTLLNCTLRSHVFPTLSTDRTASDNGDESPKLMEACRNGMAFIELSGLRQSQHRHDAVASLLNELAPRKSFKLLFVVSLLGGRVRPQDAELMQAVLEVVAVSRGANAGSVRNDFGVVINATAKQVFRAFTASRDAQQRVYRAILGSFETTYWLHIPWEDCLSSDDACIAASERHEQMVNFANTVPWLNISQDITSAHLRNRHDGEKALLQNEKEQKRRQNYLELVTVRQKEQNTQNAVALDMLKDSFDAEKKKMSDEAYMLRRSRQRLNEAASQNQNTRVEVVHMEQQNRKAQLDMERMQQVTKQMERNFDELREATVQWNENAKEWATAVESAGSRVAEQQQYYARAQKDAVESYESVVDANNSRVSLQQAHIHRLQRRAFF